MPPATEQPNASPVKASRADRLTALKNKKAELERQIAALASRETVKARKEDTRAKIIIGGAILANIKLHPETRGGIVAILEKAVTTPRDRELLASKGML
jgi:hypothetical protein